MKVKYLGEILQNVQMYEFPNIKDMRIKRIEFDSRKVETDSLFVAIRGFTSDGHAYLSEAEKRGAVAVVVEQKSDSIALPQIVVKDSRKELARMAANFYNPELSKMRLIGITGTNGKTTTSYLIRSVMESAGIKSGLVGTIAYDVAGQWIKAWNTTPESVDIFKMLYEMYNSGRKGCVLEVSSHALALNRVDFLNFEIGVFTNLTQDHLDFHKNFENYFNTKKKLFDHVNQGGRAVINQDDNYGRRLLKDVKQDIFTFGTTSTATVQAIEWESTIDGLRLKIDTPVGQIDINSSLIGQFNVENILASVATGLALNFDINTIKKGVELIRMVPGRLETVRIDGSRTVVVDYSHTPDSLQKALKVLREITNNTLWVVFGCGGDRDTSKRPIMGKIAEDYADKLVLTSDNPRSEKPQSITEMIIQGIANVENIHIELNRRNAIQYALEHSEPGDTILIAGKGHEDYQEINGTKYPFDDRKVVEEIVG
jgi:UDP-N-acetylmuramoyl-L-alanyl-D-glutamate--2,6-diaminopimelate ligase